jgi:hypothetical protein
MIRKLVLEKMDDDLIFELSVEMNKLTMLNYFVYSKSVIH